MPHDYLDEQRQTIEFVKNTRANFNVSWIDVPCERGTNEYYSMLRDYWGFDDLLLLEMDIVPTYKQLTDIENCPPCALVRSVVMINRSVNMERIPMSERKFP